MPAPAHRDSEKTSPTSSRSRPSRLARKDQSHNSEGHRQPSQEPSIGGDFGESTFQQHVKLLGDSRMSHPSYTSQRIAIMRRLQSDYGNPYVQRVVDQVRRNRDQTSQTKPPPNGPENKPSPNIYHQAVSRITGFIPSESNSNHQEASQGSESLQEVPAPELTHVVQQDDLQLHRTTATATVQRQDDNDEEEDGGGQGILGRLGGMFRRGIQSVSSVISDTRDKVVQGFQTAREIGSEILDTVSETASTLASDAVSTFREMGQALYDAGVTAVEMAGNLKESAITKAHESADWLAQKASDAGSWMKGKAIAGAEAVASAGKWTYDAIVKGKWFYYWTESMTPDEMADVIESDRPLELMAHDLAYYYPSMKDPETLQAAGYDTDSIGMREFDDGLRYVWIHPRKDDQGNPVTDPILAFRGTDNLNNVISDADPLGIGFLLFEAHDDEIKDTMKGLSGQTGQIYLTGHSLGGALA